MKLSEIRKSYEDLSQSLSKINRQLAFAGIGIIWLFRTTDSDGATSIDGEMLKPIFWFVISFGLDLLQYLWSSLVWYAYYLKKRSEGGNEDTEVAEPEWPNVPSWAMLVLKVVSLGGGYTYLGIYLYQKLMIA